MWLAPAAIARRTERCCAVGPFATECTHDRRDTQPIEDEEHAVAVDAVDGVSVLDDRDIGLVE
jgi:hypothetical protein